MKKVYVLIAFLSVMMFGLGIAKAQTPGDKPSVVRVDPALDQIISPDAKLETMNAEFGFTEGLNWVQHGQVGYLLFSDIPGNAVYKMTADGNASVYLDRSG